MRIRPGGRGICATAKDEPNTRIRILSDTFSKEFDLEAEEYVPLPKVRLGSGSGSCQTPVRMRLGGRGICATAKGETRIRILSDTFSTEFDLEAEEYVQLPKVSPTQGSGSRQISNIALPS